MGERLEAAVALDADAASCRPTRASRSCSCAARACASTTTRAREYLDFVSGIGAVNLGHAHPAVTAARRRAGRQARPREQPLLRRASRRARVRRGRPARRRHAKVFFANSGAEANEGAIKLARRGRASTSPVRYKVVTRRAVASTGARSRRSPPPASRASRRRSRRCPRASSTCPLNDIAALDDGGRRAPSRRSCSRSCRARAACGRATPSTSRRPSGCATSATCCSIIDEVQTGFFRTGPAFAHQAFGVTPDVVTRRQGARQRPADRRASSRATRSPRRSSPATTARRSAADRSSAPRPRDASPRSRPSSLGANAIAHGRATCERARTRSPRAPARSPTCGAPA